MARYRLLDYVILGGMGSFGLFACDSVVNEGRVFCRVRNFFNRFKQSEQIEVESEENFCQAENDGVEKSPQGVGSQSAAVASSSSNVPAFKHDSNFDEKRSCDEPQVYEGDEPLKDGSDDPDDRDDNYNMMYWADIIGP